MTPRRIEQLGGFADLGGERRSYRFDLNLELDALSGERMICVDYDALGVDVEHHQSDAVSLIVLGIEFVPRRDVRRKLTAVELEHLLGIAFTKRIARAQLDPLRIPAVQTPERAFERRRQLAVAKQKRHRCIRRPLHEFSLAVVQAIRKVDDGIGTHLEKRLLGHWARSFGRKLGAGQPSACGRRLLLGLGLAIAPGCKEQAAETFDTPSAASSQTETASANEPARVALPTGKFNAGTRPGRFTRQPELEPTLFEAKLGSFEIDRYPYPNHPDKPPRVGASLEEATRSCAEAGGRLCTELEWEYACSGLESKPFAGNDDTQPGCNGRTCRSTFGVAEMGSQPEWTASLFGADSPRAGSSVMRGASTSSSTPSFERRCAHRLSASPELSKEAMFRCCYGAPNAEHVHEPVDGAVFERARLDGPAIVKLLQTDPLTAPLAKDLTLFAEPDAINTVLSRGPGDRQGFDLTTSAMLWRPAVGVRFLVLAAKSGKTTSFVLAYHALGDDEYALASSFVMKDEIGPVILGYSASIRPRMLFSTCWGCLGETGRVLFRAPDTVSIVQP